MTAFSVSSMKAANGGITTKPGNGGKWNNLYKLFLDNMLFLLYNINNKNNTNKRCIWTAARRNDYERRFEKLESDD